MFFGNARVLLFVKFLWAGFVLGLASIVLKMIAKVFRKNIFLVNVFMFLFVSAFAGVYLFMCINLNNYSLSWVGLLGMVLGVAIIKISIDFFFDYFIRFIYNEFISRKREKVNGKGKIQAGKKIWELC